MERETRERGERFEGTGGAARTESDEVRTANTPSPHDGTTAEGGAYDQADDGHEPGGGQSGTGKGPTGS